MRSFCVSEFSFYIVEIARSSGSGLGCRSTHKKTVRIPNILASTDIPETKQDMNEWQVELSAAQTKKSSSSSL